MAATDCFGLVAEGKILFDSVHVGGTENLGFAQGSATFGILGLEQMPLACAVEHDFAGPGYPETFGHCFSGLNTFWTSHIFLLS